MLNKNNRLILFKIKRMKKTEIVLVPDLSFFKLQQGVLKLNNMCMKSSRKTDLEINFLILEN